MAMDFDFQLSVIPVLAISNSELLSASTYKPSRMKFLYKHLHGRASIIATIFLI
jgi:hypothetical protein